MGKAWILVACEVFFLAGFLVLGLRGPLRTQTAAGDGGLVAFPKTGDGIMRIPIEANPPPLDPVMVSSTISNAIAVRLFDTLTRFNPKLQVVPGLAERWELSEDKRTYTFHLRSGVRFGPPVDREVVAADVVYSLDRLLIPGLSTMSFLVEDHLDGAKDLWKKRAEALKQKVKPGSADWPGPLDSITTEGDRIVRVRLKEPFTAFLSVLAMSPTGIVPHEQVTAKGDRFSKEPVGSGPFRLIEWVENSHVRLAPRKNHWRGTPKIKGIFFRVVPERQVAYEEYLAGNFDVCRVPLGKLEEIRADAKLRGQLHSWANLATRYVGFSHNYVERDEQENKTHVGYAPLGTNRTLRQAFNCAVNRKYHCNVLQEGQAVPARGVLPPGMPGYGGELPIEYTYDPERARTLLAEAGYPGGQGLPPLHLLIASRPDVRPLAERLQIELRRIGVTVELRTIEWTAFLQRTKRDKFEHLFRLQWIADYPDPQNFLEILFHSDKAGDSNRSKYRNPALDKVLDEARSEVDVEKRIRLYQKAEAMIVADAAWIFLYHPQSTLLVKPYVRGLRETTTPMDSNTDLYIVDFVKLELRED